MNEADNYISLNRELWNAKTMHHLESDFYDVKGFREGVSSLNTIELELLGDVKGKSVLHLQCHFGLDTLSLARMGAKATGMDLSDKSIEEARRLADDLSLEAEFICSNIYDLPQQPDRQFDIVFTSYGVLGWLPDLEAWAAIVSRYLKPGGTFVLVEFHPVVWMFDNEFKKVEYSYFRGDAIIETQQGTYADRSAPVSMTEVGWNHSLDEVLGALLRQGLNIKDFREYNYSPYDCFSNMEKIADRKFRVKHLGDKMPMVYAIRATK